MSTPALQETGTRTFDVAWVREQFPSLKRQVEGHAAAFLDGPAGTQVPKQVIQAIEDYFVTANANTCGLTKRPPRGTRPRVAMTVSMSTSLRTGAVIGSTLSDRAAVSSEGI